MVIEGIEPGKVRHGESLAGFAIYEQCLDLLGGRSKKWRDYCSRWMLDHNPAILYTRQWYADKFFGLINEPYETMREHGLQTEDWSLSTAYLNWTLRQFGLCSNEEVNGMFPGGGKQGKRVDYWRGKAKYLTFEEATEKSARGGEAGEVWGLVHGDVDPPHWGHLLLMGLMSFYCDKLLVGFDPIQINKERKENRAQGDVRPRFPLEYRMWHVAALGVVDGVFVMPIKELDNERFLDIYRQLGIGYLGVGTNNPLRQEYARRMDEVGGYLVVNPLPVNSSTETMQKFKDPDYEPMSPIRWMVGDEVRMTCEAARKAGYLREYSSR